jgi:hypothetical protein
VYEFVGDSEDRAVGVESIQKKRPSFGHRHTASEVGTNGAFIAMERGQCRGVVSLQSTFFGGIDWPWMWRVSFVWSNFLKLQAS